MLVQCELASSESLSSSPVFAMIVRAAVRKGRSQFTEDDFVPEKKRPRPNPKKKQPKQRFATISSKEIEAAKKSIVVKNT